ncbi:hypothetical protein NQ176_g6413 [Zarea fungicola]|uniref:Uncharacterized protein n=1 Tax=Zarea fungicola TaxID=93591 RepID=A0ACC1N3G7_9HYPO|nr:hypothetical protein NQ176_g6413 [Lecanicillium fungicola]
MAEQLSIIDWTREHGIVMELNPLIATPYGYIKSLHSTEEKYETEESEAKENSETEEKYKTVYKELGIDTSYPRSVLPLGIIFVGKQSMWKWAFPGRDGVARDGRATDSGIQRIEWPTR